MFDLLLLIKTLGYFGIFGIIFAESGLFFGFFLPGDSLLFTAGFLSSQGLLNVYVLAFFGCLFAIAGDSVGYSFGKLVGPKMFTKEDSLFFKREHLRTTEDFFAKYGRKAVFLARFLPVVRTIAPIFAGVGRMNYKIFLAYNILGALFWAGGLVLAGFYLGSAIPNADRYITPIVIAIIVVSLLPTAFHVYKEKAKKADK